MRCIAFSYVTSQVVPMLAKQIGANIKAARKARGLSLENVAAAIDPPTSYQQLSRLEDAERPLTLEWVERIGKALNVDPMELLSPSGASTAPQAIHLDEQVATEAARSLAAAALGEPEPAWGTVQAVSLVLQELLALFSIHPEAARDVQVARPALTLARRRFGHEAH
jgi:transcriptional regulator with XRE-family HTH domain